MRALGFRPDCQESDLGSGRGSELYILPCDMRTVGASPWPKSGRWDKRSRAVATRNHSGEQQFPASFFHMQLQEPARLLPFHRPANRPQHSTIKANQILTFKPNMRQDCRNIFPIFRMTRTHDSDLGDIKVQQGLLADILMATYSQTIGVPVPVVEPPRGRVLALRGIWTSPVDLKHVCALRHKRFRDRDWTCHQGFPFNCNANTASASSVTIAHRTTIEKERQCRRSFSIVSFTLPDSSLG